MHLPNIDITEQHCQKILNSELNTNITPTNQYIHIIKQITELVTLVTYNK